MEWLITDVTPVRSPARAESKIMDDFGVFWPIQVAFVVGESLCNLKSPF